MEKSSKQSKSNKDNFQLSEEYSDAGTTTSSQNLIEKQSVRKKNQWKQPWREQLLTDRPAAGL